MCIVRAPTIALSLSVAGLPRGEPMEARKLLEAAPFDPDTVQTLIQAFDQAWTSICPTIPPDRVADTRMSLAHAIVANASMGEVDCEALKAAAIKVVRRNPPQDLG